ncbi:phage tail sheath C-terminal domain-containing protein [Gordonia sp. LSe1-13]|uniref:Phage tail sheath C-terminal domain-containing protein n=1 Tax=Gordonia sesuvii TaxID=3116777 RepID=A0ABU7MC25_9ACTN|nr:phage tail sheath C-terminal domain-containing protein [Gordonia sp. LSe1-13]
MPSYLSPGVYVEEVDSGSRPIEGVGTAVAAFVGLAEKGPFDSPTLVANWTQFTATFGGFMANTSLAQAVFAYFQNGGGNCYIVRIGQDGSGSPNGSPHRSIEPGAAQAEIGNVKAVALESGSADGHLSVEIAEPDEGAPEGSVKLVVKRGDEVVETHTGTVGGRGQHNLKTVVANDSKLIKIEVVSGQSGGELVPGQSAALVAPAPTAEVPSTLSSEDYVGKVETRTGFSGLEAIDDITMVAIPDLMTAYAQKAVDLDTVKQVQLAMIAHCELMGDRMAILDTPPGLNAQQIKQWRTETAGYDSKYAAMYWPWVGVGKGEYLPPSGFMAGIWGRNDDTRGVHKAPANEVVRGAVEIETQITRNEHDMLNPYGINCIRAFPGRGIRVWGARTLSSDPSWRYLNIRRLFNYLEESILDGTNWVVFEPNDPALWARLRRTISAFLTNEWRRGALFGLTPDEAFFVKCDAETNPAEGIDAGEVVCQIGVAPVKPAEFVIFRLSQYSGGTSLVAE